MKSSKVFWGIFFILAAVYVVISKFGILPDIGVFSIILSVFFLWLFVEGIRNVNFWEILFSIAFICIIYDEPLGITALTPWTVLGAAFLGSIGLSLTSTPTTSDAPPSKIISDRFRCTSTMRSCRKALRM